MSEATTAAAATEAPEAQVGAVVQFHPGEDRAQLAIVSSPGTDNDTVQVISPGPGDDELVTHTTSRRRLRPAPHELSAGQWGVVQRLTMRLAGDAHDRGERLQRCRTSLQQQADAAQQTIASMRAYAIRKHIDGVICREGLNNFLTAHDLETYEPRHCARVTVNLAVEVYGADTEYQVAGRVGDYIEVRSIDKGEVCITDDHGIDVSDVEQIAEG